MAFDEVRLPLRVGNGTSGGPVFATEIVTVEGGFEKRNQLWSEARRRYDAQSGVKSAADAAALVAFFEARAGRARGFRLQDWLDYTSSTDGRSQPGFADQFIGTGDGTTTSFQLVKNYGGALAARRRAIKKPVAGSVKIGLNGQEAISGWSVDDVTGLVNFSIPPATGMAITAGFVFDVPVRFDTDQLFIQMEGAQLVKTEIPLVEIRQ